MAGHTCDIPTEGDEFACPECPMRFVRCQYDDCGQWVYDRRDLVLMGFSIGHPFTYGPDVDFRKHGSTP